MSPDRGGMKRMLGKWDSVAIVIAIVVGVGIFRTPSEVARYLSSPGLILLAWIAGAAISLAGALCYAELSSTFPRTGGNYVYLKKSFGKLSAFLFGWTEILVVRAGSIAAVAFIFAEYLCSFLGAGEVLVKITAVICIAVLGAVNAAGLRYGKNTQNVLVIIKISALAAMILLGFASGEGSAAHFQAAKSAPDGPVPVLFGLALIPVLWTYGGWHENVFMAGETKDAGRTLPFALITGILAVAALYILTNFLYIYLFPVEVIKQSGLAASRVFDVIWGGAGKKTFEAVVIISSFAAINAMIMTGSRITYAMAADNPVFRYLGRIGENTGTPYRAIALVSLWSAALVVWGSFERLLFFTGFLVWGFFALVVSGLFVLREKYPHIPRPYKVRGYPAVPLGFAAVSAALSAVTFFSYTASSLTGLGIMCAGLPVYLMSERSGMTGIRS